MKPYLEAIWFQYQRDLAQARTADTRAPVVWRWLVAALLLASGALLVVLTRGYHGWFFEVNFVGSFLPDALLEHITLCGDGALAITLLVILLGRRHYRLHWAAFIATIIGAIFMNIIKREIYSPRPPKIYDVDTFHMVGPVYHWGGFPSGHTLTIFMLATLVAVCARSRSVGALAFGFAAIVGLSRIWVGLHWPVDVLIGAAMGIVIGIFSVLLAARWRHAVIWQVHLPVLLLFMAGPITLFVKVDYVEAQAFAVTMGILAIALTLWRLLRLSPTRESGDAALSGRAET
ncbi:MAG: phosphatase PAP2 family protein [Pseudomonadales bacterium]|nr:phosphatase PAP2 family protein [Pseudomonadales bacterium]